MGAARKYMLYAIGEIALVVIGILIALQINNWNEWREDRKSEVTLLLNLKVDMEKSLDQLVLKTRMVESSRENAKYIISLFGEDQNRPSDRQLDTIISRITILHTFEPQESVINEIISSGKTDLIRNDSLRNSILSWESYLLRVKEAEKVMYDYAITQIQPFLNERMSLADIYSAFSHGRGTDFRSSFSFDKSALFNDIYFENVLTGRYTSLGLVHNHYIWLQDFITELLQVIKDELGE